MNRQACINEIIKYSSRFIEEVKQYNALSLYDINIHAENFLIPVLNKSLDLDLENLNTGKQKNYPSIDLADFKNRVGIQISSTSTSTKVKDTIVKFNRHSLYEYFDVIYFFFLSEKQSKYPKDKIAELVDNRFHFDTDEHILDNSDLVKKLSNLSLEKLIFLSRIYKHEFSDIQIQTREKKIKSGFLKSESEDLYCNLLNIEVPKSIFSAEIYLDEELILNRINIYREGRGWTRLKKIKHKGQLLKNQLIYEKIYSNDWVLRNGRIYTFRNLHDGNEGLSAVVDMGTIEENSCEDYYLDNDDSLNVFKNLLRNTIISDLYFKDLEWVNEKKIIRFRLDQKNKGVKRVSWTATNKAKKTVIFEMRNKKENHIICYKHLAFKPGFELLDNNWYLVINPTWSFTNPGGKRQSRFEESYLSGIKRMESNKAVYYFYRFWSYYLRYTDMFTVSKSKLKLAEFEPMEFVPRLVDEKWLPSKDKGNDKIDNSNGIDEELTKTLFD